MSSCLDSYLQQKSLLNIPIQNARMALFCVEYMLSHPFSPSITSAQVKEFSINGYYAFLEYAASYWLHHSIAAFDPDPNCDVPADLMNELGQKVGRFLQDAHILDDLDLNSTLGAIPSISNILSQIRQDPVAGNNWTQLESRITRIIGALEFLAEDSPADSATATKRSMLTMYGMTVYRCPKLGCVHFQQGFVSGSERDSHQDRHLRPFLCTEIHCPFQVLGFANQIKLKLHVAKSHRITGEIDRSTFPQLRSTKKGNIIKAVERGDADVIKDSIFSAKCEDKDLKKEDVASIFDFAVRQDRLDICEILFDRGAVVTDDHIRSAISHDNPELLEIILKTENNWAQVCLRSFDGEPSSRLLHFAATKDGSLIVKLLLSRADIDPDAGDQFGRTALHMALYHDRQKIVRLLLATGKVDPNSKSIALETPMSMAISNNSLVAAETLLNNGKIDMEARNSNHETLLLQAARLDFERMVQLLLAIEGVGVNAKDDRGRMPITFASMNRNSGMVGMLLDNSNIDPDARANNGATPLCYACGSYIYNSVDRPLGHIGRAPRSVQEIESDRIEIVRMLLGTGRVSINSITNVGETPLMLAVQGRNEDIMKLLLSTGQCDIDAKDLKGQTALSIAKSSGTKSMIDLLLAAGATDHETKNNMGQDSTTSGGSESHALQDYQKQLMLLEQRKRALQKQKQRNRALQKLK